MQGIKLYIVIGSLVAALLAGFGGGWLTNGWRLNAKLDRQKTAYTQALAEATQEALDKQKENAKKLGEIDAKRTKELSNAQKQISDLRARVANGTIGLRIAANCGSMPASDSAPSVGDGTTAGLTGNAEQYYFALREAIARVTAQLVACQDIVKSAQ